MLACIRIHSTKTAAGSRRLTAFARSRPSSTAQATARSTTRLPSLSSAPRRAAVQNTRTVARNITIRTRATPSSHAAARAMGAT
ncbi:unnamed protein product, partial [Mesorhabditis belari]|uniref:Uncharacterized protein n=1 Tax=Mesorhabditis belari TaxID=2138241 RepID=A0AAF3J9A6_9BILA